MWLATAKTLSSIAVFLFVPIKIGSAQFLGVNRTHATLPARIHFELSTLPSSLSPFCEWRGCSVGGNPRQLWKSIKCSETCLNRQLMVFSKKLWINQVDSMLGLFFFFNPIKHYINFI